MKNSKPKDIEFWKDILNYEGYYQVSNLGRIRSLDRLIDFFNYHSQSKVKRIRKGHIMKPGSTPNGYTVVRFSKNSISKYCSVHRLVATAFIDNPYNFPQINHLNGNKKDNNSTNLE